MTSGRPTESLTYTIEPFAGFGSGMSANWHGGQFGYRREAGASDTTRP